MSQASRRHALRHETERRQVALEVAKLELTADIVCANCTGMGIDFDVNCTADGCATRALGGSGFTAHDAGPNCEATCTLCEGEGTGRAALALALLTYPPQGFDVHAARAHATGLVLYGRHHARVSRRLELDGEGHPRWATPVGDWAEGKPGAPWPHLGGDDLAFVRLGQRILDALEGQPSECGGCWAGGLGHGTECACGHNVADLPGGGWRLAHADGDPYQCPACGVDWPACPDCHGTSRNLRGVLPPVEWSPTVRRRARDAEVARGEVNQQRGSWTFAILDSLPTDQLATVLDRKTRVCPRGGHRPLDDGTASRLWSMSQWAPDSSRRAGRAMALLPAWRRGEIEHARQRREREARRQSVGGLLPVIAWGRAPPGLHGGVMVSQPMRVLRLDE